MSFRHVIVCALAAALGSLPHAGAFAQSSGALTLTRALQRALAVNPRLTAAEREVGIAAGRRIQAGAIPNPDLSFELDNALGSGKYRGLDSAETTLQLSQLIELGGKREARVAAGSCGVGCCPLAACDHSTRNHFRHDRYILHCAQRAAPHPDLRRADRLPRPADAVVAAPRGSRCLLSCRNRAFASGFRSGPSGT